MTVTTRRRIATQESIPASKGLAMRMMVGIASAVLCVAIGDVSVSAQVSAQEAARRLEERRLARESAPTTASAPPASRPATRPARPPAELHAEAVLLMRAGKFAQAGPLLEQAQRATPAAEIGRSLILNQAMVDVVQRINAMRAVKNVQQYLATHPEVDETAVDLLGAALSTAASANRKIRENELYKAARRQLDNAVAALERSRPRERRWGSRWVSRDDYESLYRQIADAQDAHRDALRRADDAKRRLATAQAEFQRYNVIVVGARHNHNDRIHGSTRYCEECIAIRAAQRKFDSAKASLNIAEAELRTRTEEAVRAFEAIPEPEWAATFNPLDP